MKMKVEEGRKKGEELRRKKNVQVNEDVSEK